MPRQKSLITIIRDLVRHEVSQTMAGLLAGLTGGTKPPAKKRGPGRPPGKKRGPGRPKGSKNKPKVEV